MKSVAKKCTSLIKMMFILLPLVWILWTIDLQKVGVQFASVPWWVIPSFLLLLFIRLWLQSYRFQYLSRHFTRSIRVTDLFVLDMKSRYYSLVIPSSVGQDIVRGAMLTNHLTTDQIVSLSLFFRITGMIPFLVLSLFGVVQLTSRQGFAQLMPALVASTVLFVGGFAVLYSRRLSSFTGRLLSRVIPAKIRTFLRSVVLAFQQFRSNPTRMFLNVCISMLAQSITVVIALILVKGVTGSWYPIEMLTFIPVIELMAVLVPFAPNGLGVREVMGILLFTSLGRSREEMLVYIAINSISHLVNLIGIIPVLYEKIVVKNSLKK